MTYKKYACIDIGLKRIGFCLCINGISMAQKPIFRKNRNQASQEISILLKKHDIDILIVGIPINENSQEMQRRIKHFTSLLEFDKQIYYEDEAYSSLEAKELTKGIMKQKKDGKIDSLSAKIIFDRWFEKHNKKHGNTKQ